MLSKVVTGGLLVAMIGGVPGVTYLLTRDSENKNTVASAEGPVKDIPKTKPNCPSEQEDCQEDEVACPSDRSEDNCPAQEKK